MPAPRRHAYRRSLPGPCRPARAGALPPHRRSLRAGAPGRPLRHAEVALATLGPHQRPQGRIRGGGRGGQQRPSGKEPSGGDANLFPRIDPTRPRGKKAPVMDIALTTSEFFFGNGNLVSTGLDFENTLYFVFFGIFFLLVHEHFFGKNFDIGGLQTMRKNGENCGKITKKNDIGSEHIPATRDLKKFTSCGIFEFNL